jgi:hypothetical protein
LAASPEGKKKEKKNVQTKRNERAKQPSHTTHGSDARARAEFIIINKDKDLEEKKKKHGTD